MSDELLTAESLSGLIRAIEATHVGLLELSAGGPEDYEDPRLMEEGFIALLRLILPKGTRIESSPVKAIFFDKYHETYLTILELYHREIGSEQTKKDGVMSRMRTTIASILASIGTGITVVSAFSGIQTFGFSGLGFVGALAFLVSGLFFASDLVVAKVHSLKVWRLRGRVVASELRLPTCLRIELTNLYDSYGRLVEKLSNANKNISQLKLDELPDDAEVEFRHNRTLSIVLSGICFVAAAVMLVLYLTLRSG